ncbi:unannotated protein [freshwater metagenome]|uniref:Unannotated protein n=1 Tax=freshwater metagenome TaxID=449393 RepID=A0A6J7GS74_9ZZZZ|nr:hypothetical protein [Actinomycetota bacterium]
MPEIVDCVVSRALEQERTTYVIRTLAGRHIDTLTFREVMALAAAEGGRIHARWRRCSSPWFSDQYLSIECEDYGVGRGTISQLRGSWGRPDYLEPTKAEGLVGLTQWGRDVLEDIRRLSPTIGVHQQRFACAALRQQLINEETR